MMNPSNGLQQRAEATAPTPTLQLNRDVNKLSLEPLPDNQNSSERTMDDHKQRLREITQLIANEKWRELDSFLRSSTIGIASSCEVASPHNTDDAIDNDDDFVSSMYIGKKLVLT